MRMVSKSIKSAERGMAVRQPGWNRYEVALLIEAFWKIKADKTEKKTIIEELSTTLRQSAKFEIDDTYRNINGIRMRLEELEWLFSSEKAGLKNTSALFRNMVELYNTDQDEFQSILLEAKKAMDVHCLNTANQKNKPVRLDDTILEYFEAAKNLFPDYIFTNLNAKNERVRRAVYIYPKNTQRRGNVLFEIWHLSTEGTFALYMKSVLLTDAEMKESMESWDKTSSTRGRITRQYKYRQDLVDYVISRLEATPTFVSGDVSYSQMPVVLQPGSDSAAFEVAFAKWLISHGMAETSCRSYLSFLRTAEAFAQDHNFAEAKLCTLDKDLAIQTSTYLMNDTAFAEFNLSKHSRYSRVIQLLTEFFSDDEPLEESINLHSSSQIRESWLDTLGTQISELLKESTDGIRKSDIVSHFSNYSTYQINKAIESIHAVLVMEKYYHRDNLFEYDQMAEALLEVITKQFAAYGNYTSAQILYNEAKTRLDDFFFYNGAFDSRSEVYDLAMHLFRQEKFRGNEFIFSNGMHIWKEEPNYPKDYHGLLIKYARENDSVFTRDEAEDYLKWIGSTSPSATFSNVIFTTGRNTFLQYSENKFVLSEALHINDYFLSTVDMQINSLLEGEDYIPIGEIDDYFYTTLPRLPGKVSWSPLLLEDIFRIYETGFTTFDAGQDNDKKTYPAAIVRKNSHYKNFGDLVWSEVSKCFQLPKEFTSSEFRAFLLDKGFIRGMEKMWSVHKTVAGDIRFYWTENNGKVTIN